MDNNHCRFCGHELRHTFLDLGLSPLSNEYLQQSDLNRGQVFYPLKVNVCENCFLTQAAMYQRPEQIFGDDTAHTIVSEDGAFDLVIGNNVLAHVPDINGFVAGLAVILKDTGTITMEFPHLMQLIQYSQFDTIYHEHFYYLSLVTVDRIFRTHGLKIYDVEQLPTHGGSLRIYAGHVGNAEQRISGAVHKLLEEERRFGLEDIKSYTTFSEKAQKIKLDTLHLFSELRQNGKHIAAFGAAAKGNTFLNYCGMKRDTIDFVVDSNPHKRGFCLPGSLIPIVGVETLRKEKPEYLVILPWNLSEEIMDVAGFVQEWGCKFITCIPEVKIWD